MCVYIYIYTYIYILIYTYITNIDGIGLYQRQNASKSQELCGLCFENHRFSMAEVPTAMADMEKPPLIYGEKDGFNLGEAANPRNMCVFFFHSLVVPTCQETSQVEVPSDLFCGWQQPWRCWTVLGLMLSPKLLSSNASGGRGFQGLRGCGAWGYRAQGLTWTKNLPW